MRLLTRLTARAETVYDDAYHHKLRGRVWNALEGTKYGNRHGKDGHSGFSFSNPFPPYDMEANDERTVIFASPEDDLLSHIASNLKADRRLNIGEMPFRVDELSVLDPDVGEPGTSGTIETGTGILVRLYKHHRNEYGIELEDVDDTATFWRPEHSMEPFIDAIENNAQTKHDQFVPDYLPGPTDVDGPLFDGYELIKTYAIPLTVTQGVEREMVLSKWRFDYTVRDDDHRRHLNLLLDCGIGARNGLGLGFINIADHD